MVSAEHVVATCFHGDYGISSVMSRKLDLLLKYSGEVDRLILSNSTMFQRFKEWGFPSERMRLISVGVDLERFTPVTEDLREFSRSRLGIPQGAVVIGSFQKDGDGWGEGLEPKFVKGPDIFCDVLELLARDLPLHVLLTGPARGYVKQRLLRSGITFTHHLLKSSDDLPSYYHACDCYLMCSREEGGPKSVPEAMACGIPLVATRTGLARDVEANCGVGWFADVGDVDELVRLTREALCDKENRHDYLLLCKKHASTFSWENIGKSHLNILHELI